MINKYFLLFSALILTSCVQKIPAIEADRIFFGGTILTMDDAQAQVEAVAIKDGKIIMRGTKRDALAHKGAGTELWDLKGKAMLPGFIDASVCIKSS